MDNRRGSFRGSQRPSDRRGGFRGNSSSRNGRGGFRSSQGPREMHGAVCADCGEECKVPFRPTSSKPIYCNDCFSKKDKSSSSRNSSKDFEIINEKLDKIMKALKIE